MAKTAATGKARPPRAGLFRKQLTSNTYVAKTKKTTLSPFRMNSYKK
jgi:hypothetical protein